MLKREYKFRDGKCLTIGKKTCVMGILNVTDDSFSDGGKFADLSSARAHLTQLVNDGADIIDIGAESTRPGATPLSAKEEMQRLLPFLEELLPLCPVPISVDTYHPTVAQTALERGAHILNDVGGLAFNGETLGNMLRVAAKFNAPLIVTHGGDDIIDENTNVTEDVGDFFASARQMATAIGLAQENLLFDPGIGFSGKTTAQNLTIIKNLRQLKQIGDDEMPLVIGASRKRFIGAVLDAPVDMRLFGTAAVCAAAAMSDAEIVRVHDVREIVDVCRMIDAIKQAGD